MTDPRDLPLVGLDDVQTIGLYRSFFDDAPDAMLAVAEDGTVLAANEATGDIFGYRPEDVVGRPVERLLPPRYAEGHISRRASFFARPARRAMGVGLELWGRRHDGREFPVDVSLSVAVIDGQTIALAAVRDVTVQHDAESALRESEARFRQVFEHSPVGIAIIDREVVFRHVNAALARLLETECDALEGRPLVEVTPAENSTRYRDVIAAVVERRLEQGEVEKRLVTASGQIVWVRASFSAMAGGDDAALVMFEDITERKRSEAHLAHLATHDALTGLANRALASERIHMAHTRARRTDQRFGVLFIDLDGFKDVNDANGHVVGDAVLAEIARRIAGVVRPEDTVARQGGDEFLVCCEDIGHDDETARMTLAALAERILAAIAESGAGSASIGIVMGTGSDDDDPSSTIALADAAMYEAKRAGGGQAAFAAFAAS